MTIWKRVRAAWPGWPWRHGASRATDGATSGSGDAHLALARESLRELLDDPRVPAEVREALAQDYEQVQAMLDKLEHGHIHIAAFGRVSTGKSSLLNALLGADHFAVSPLHGQTRHAEMRSWEEFSAGGVYLIDTPGLDEIGGEERERLAREVAARVDLVLFVADGDLTDLECAALGQIAAQGRPVLLVLNKADRYAAEELTLLRATLAERARGLVDPENILCAAARPAPLTHVRVDATGSETEIKRPRERDVLALKDRLWNVLEQEGKTLAALNAGLFAGRLSEQVARRILATRRALGDRLVRTYCIAKGVAVALNPVPVADLAAAALIDGTMIFHLSRLYGLPLTRAESGSLVGTIAAQMAALMGTVWVVHLISAALKVGTGGVSTAITAGAQGAVAYYSTYVVGKVAERYLVQGRSWGEGGPKQLVRQILDGLDRESILGQARDDIRAYLHGGSR